MKCSGGTHDRVSQKHSSTPDGGGDKRTSSGNKDLQVDKNRLGVGGSLDKKCRNSMTP